MSKGAAAGNMEGNGLCDATGWKLRAEMPPMLMYGASSLDLGALFHGFGAQGQVKFGWRSFPVLPTKPSSTGWTLVGSALNSDGESDETVSLTTTTDALWVQGGLFTGLASGSTAESVMYRVWGTIPGSGWLVARQRLLLRATSSDMVLPIGNPFPCAGVTGMMVGLRFMGINGTIVAPTTVYRTFKTGDRMYPESWTTLSAESNVSADSNVNSRGTMTTTGKILGQAGLKYSTTGTNPYGVVEAIVAVKDS